MDLGILLQPSSWAAVATLSLLEIVLGIDNLVFIAILSARLPKERQKAARQLGLAAALVSRLALLFSITWIMTLTRPFATFTLLDHHVDVTGKALILFAGGLFLVWKSVKEIYHKVELKDGEEHVGSGSAAFGAVILNIAIMDVVFSLDSVITAVGMVAHVELMVAGVLIAMAVMIAFANGVSEFVNSYPSLKILALAFLLMIGTLLTAEALEFTIPKGFVYFAMAFSLLVEFIEIRYETNLRRREGSARGESA